METMQPYTTPRRSLLREKEQLISHSCPSLLAADYLDRTQSARDNLLFSQHCMVIPYTAMRVSLDWALPLMDKLFLGESAKLGSRSGMLDLDVLNSS